MKNLIFLLLIFISSKTLACPAIQGKWSSCSVSSSLFNSLEVVAANIALKTLTFDISNPSTTTIRSKIIKDTIFSSPETIMDEVSLLNKNNKSVWDKNVFENSTPPVLTIYMTCSANGMTEYITWENLSVANYPDHATGNYPKYFKSLYGRSGNKLVRKIYSKGEKDGSYNYLARITCSKK